MPVALPPSDLLREIVTRFLMVAAYLVKLTKTTIDDAVVSALDKLVGSDAAWNVFYRILQRLVGEGDEPAPVVLMPAEEEELRTMLPGVPVGVFVLILQLAWKLWQEFGPNRQPIV
jgi:hypothetical protein